MFIFSLNLLAYLAVVLVNFLANYLPINGQTSGEISDRLHVLFTPAGYVFSIWGLIYLLVGIWVLSQLPKSRRENEVYTQTFPAFIVSCILNISWLLLWHYEYFILSVSVIIALLATLIVIYTKIKAVSHSFLSLAPFSIYLGWLSVATIANISYVLVDIKWEGFGLSDITWTIMMLFVATILAIVFRVKYNDWLYPLVFVWAFIGIGVQNGSNESAVSYTAYALAAILFIFNFVIGSWNRTSRKETL